MRCCPSTRRVERAARPRRLPVGPGLVAPVHPDRVRPSPTRRRRPVIATGADDVAGLTVRIEIELLPSGLVRQRATVTSTAAGPYALDGPAPDAAGAAGGDRAARPHRAAGAASARRSGSPSSSALHSRENRRGRTGPDAPLILAAGTAGFGFARRRGLGRARGVERQPRHLRRAARRRRGRCSAAASCCCPARSCSAAARRYTTPWVYAALRRPASTRSPARFHSYLRPRPQHPRGPRPVVLNTWEAVYFDHDLDAADRARPTRPPRSGVERFVLDDGWFRDRRDDPAGLGDWYVDETVWPDGLHPLVDARPRARACSSGSGSSRRWSTRTPTWPARTPTGSWRPAAGCRRRRATSRCSTSAHPDAYDYILERLDALLTRVRRSPTSSGTTTATSSTPATRPTGAAGVHAQTLAVYRLLDELRAAPPRRWRSSRARPAAPASTSASSSAPTGSGRSDCNDAAGAPADPALDRAAAAAGADRQPRRRRRARTPPAARTTWRSAPAPRCSATSASSGTSPRPTADERARAGRLGRALQGAARRCCTPARSSAPTTPTRPSRCTASSRRTGRTRCSRWSSWPPRRPRCPAPCGCPAWTRPGATGSGRSRRATGPPVRGLRAAARGSPRASPCRARPSSTPGLRAPALFPEQLLLVRARAAD